MKYDVEITNVREVSLLGRADLAYWKERLRPEGLHPTSRDGWAEVMICAVDARFMCRRFRELSISVFVSRHEDGASRDGAFLTHAFNSSRFFAFVERRFFHTPYHPARIEVEVEPPSFEVRRRGDSILRMDRRATGEAIRVGEEVWEGPVFLPVRTKVFFARLSGHVVTHSFVPSVDVATMVPSDDVPVLRELIASRFEGVEWMVRANATHGKSKTVVRAAADAMMTS